MRAYVLTPGGVVKWLLNEGGQQTRAGGWLPVGWPDEHSRVRGPTVLEYRE